MQKINKNLLIDCIPKLNRFNEKTCISYKKYFETNQIKCKFCIHYYPPEYMPEENVTMPGGCNY